jgi:hypothetical protein
MEGFAYSLPSPSHAIRWRLRRWRNGIGRRNGRNGKSIEHGNNTPTSADQKYGASLAQRLPWWCCRRTFRRVRRCNAMAGIDTAGRSRPREAAVHRALTRTSSPRAASVASSPTPAACWPPPGVSRRQHPGSRRRPLACSLPSATATPFRSVAASCLRRRPLCRPTRGGLRRRLLPVRV